MAVQKHRVEFSHWNDPSVWKQQRSFDSVSAFGNFLIIRREEHLPPPTLSGESIQRIGNQLVVNIEDTSNGTGRQAHRQCIHSQSVIEQVIQFTELLFLSHLVKNPNGKAVGSGSKTGVGMVIAHKIASP